MPEPETPDHLRLARLAGLLLLSLVLWMGAERVPDYGVTWDEMPQRRNGRDALPVWFAPGGADDSGDMVHLHGPLFPALTVLACRAAGLPDNHPDIGHLVIFLTAWLGLVGFWLLARRLAGAWPALLALALLLLIPRWWGHAFNNPKDLPFAAGFIWAFYFADRWARDGGWGNLAGLTLATGVLAAMRQDGIAIWIFVALGLVIWRGRERRGPARPAGLALLAAGTVALVLLLFPWLRRDPAFFFRLVGHGGGGAAGREILFNGRVIDAADQPFWYLPAWIALTTPLFILAGFLLGLVRLARGGGDRRPWLPVLLWLAWPLLLTLATGAAFYDGLRHGLYVLPALALVAAFGFAGALARLAGLGRGRWPALAAGLLLAVAGADTARQMAALHPYQSVYFNRAVGGVAGAAGRFETEYWGQTVLAGLVWLRQRGVEPGSRLYTNVEPSVANCYLKSSPGYFAPAGSRFSHRESLPETGPAWLLLIPRGRGYRAWEAGGRRPEPAHVVSRAGAPLLVILHRPAPPAERRPGDPPVSRP